MNRLDSLLALLALDRLPRTGWVQRGVPAPESIAGHMLGSAQIALILAEEVDVPLDLSRLLRMLLVHDAPEALTGDLPRAAAALLPTGAKQAMEEGAAGILFESAPACSQAWREFTQGLTREARFARLCDKLQLGLRLLAYRRQGLRGLEEFEVGLGELDASEFPAAEALRRELVSALAQVGPHGPHED
jgi:putative hydrolase of HD superfamily